MRIPAIILFTCLLVVSSCNSSESNHKFVDEELMIEVPSSQLYIRVRGNPEKPLIINLHGGPGGYSGIDIKVMS